MRFSRALGFVAAVALIGTAVAQEPKQTTEAPTFKSRVEAVTIATIVRDSSGKHVPGLKAADFAIYEQGKLQRVASVEEYVTTPTLPHAAGDKNNNTYTNAIVAEGERSRVTIILLDLLNSNFADQWQARRHLAKFLGQWDSQEPVALAVLTCKGLEVAHTFTRDPKLLIAALNQVEVTAAYNAPNDDPEPPRVALPPALTISEALARAAFFGALDHAFEGAICGLSDDFTAKALYQLGGALSGLPGRKSLVWLTAGLLTYSRPEEFRSLLYENYSALARDPTRALRWSLERDRAYKSLVDANVAIYPVDVKGLIAYVPITRDPMNPAADIDLRTYFDDSRISDLRGAAEMTGGRAFYRSNDLADGLRRAVDDSKSYYMLTYYRNTRDNGPGWRSLKVKVNRPGTEVRARQGYVVLGPIPPANTRKMDLAAATGSALDLTAMPLEAHVDCSNVVNGERRVDFSLHVPGTALTVDNGDNNHVIADWLVVVLKDGKTTANRGQTVDVRATDAELRDLNLSGLNYKSFVSVPETGNYTLRFIIRDGISGRTGTVTVPLSADGETATKR